MKELEEKLLESEKKCKFYQDKYEQAARAYDQLLFALKQFQRREFGAKSEHFKDQAVQQWDMFSQVPAKLPEQDDNSVPETDVASTRLDKKKRHKKSQHFAKGLPRREIIIPAENKQENDVVIRYEEKEYLHYIPPVYEVVIEKREVVKSVDPDTGLVKLYAAPAPKRLLQSGVTENFLAHIIVGKIYDCQPLYHLEKKFSARFNFICPRNKLARWFIDSAQALQPLVNLLRDEVLDYDVASCDPTHIQVLNEPGRLATQKSYIYTIRGGPPEREVSVFEYHPEEHKDFLQDWFSGFEGYLQVDGQNIFDIFKGNPKVKLAYCNVHSRRKFEPIAKGATQSGLAIEAMRFL
jgi:transposase